MPSGIRFRATVRGKRFDLSPEQYEILTKKTFKLKFPFKWGDQQRINGLVLKKLFRKEDNKYTRTNLGDEVAKEFKANLKSKGV